MWVAVVESESWIKLSFKTQFHIRELSLYCYYFAKLCLTLLTPWTAAHQDSLSSLSPKVCSNSCSLSQRCHPTISSSAVPFSPPAFNLSQHQEFLQWVGSSHQVAQILEFQLQHQSFQWIFNVGSTGLISLQSKGQSRVFCSTTAQKHQFFSAQLSL